MVSTPHLEPVTFNVTIDGIGFFHEAVVMKHQHAVISLPVSAYLVGTGKQHKTVVVCASQGVSVYGMNFDTYVVDGFIVIPSIQLGTQYFLASYLTYHSTYPSEWSVSALNMPTIVDVNTKQKQHYQVSLQPYKTYQFQASGLDDITGSFINASNPIAVMAGCECAQIPHTLGGCGALFEQVPAVKDIGREYILAPFPDRTSGYIYRIIGTNPQTSHIEISDGSNSINLTLEAGEFYEDDVYGGAIVRAISDQSILTVQYMKGGISEDPGDPSMVILPAYEMFGQNVTFSVFEADADWGYYISVTIMCKFIDGLTFDEDQSMATWDILRSSDNEMCVSRGPVTPSAHSVGHSSSDAVFYVMVTGHRQFGSYAYSAGYNLFNGKKQMTYKILTIEQKQFNAEVVM